jgi:hypothetical protein
MSKVSSVDLSYVDPRVEAQNCLRIARANSGVEKTRELISISPEQERILHRLAASGELSQLIVFRAVAYRAQVLDEFDQLVTKKRSAKKFLGHPAKRSDNRPREATMKYSTEFDPIPCDAGDVKLEKHQHHFEDNARVTVISGAHAGRSAKLQAVNNHGGHVVKLDDGNIVEYTNKELAPEGFYSRSEKMSAIGIAMSRGAILKAGASSDDPLPLGEPLAKRRKVDPSQLQVGMLIKGPEGKPTAKITKISGGAVSFEFDGGSGMLLADHVEAA